DAFISRFEITSSGKYYVRVWFNGWQGSSTGAYLLRVDLARGIQLEKDGSYVNDTTSTANLVTLQPSGTCRTAIFSGTIMSPEPGNVDEDYFNLGPVDEGESIFLSIRLPGSSRLRPVIDIRRGDGGLVGVAPNPTSTVGRVDVGVGLNQSGVYYAAVLGLAGYGPYGQYLLDIAICRGIQYPDLAIGGITGPTAAQTGQTVQFTWTAGNFGNGPTSATVWYDRLVLSTDETYGNEEDLKLASARHTGALQVGEEYTAAVADVQLPKCAPGTYWVFVEVDENNDVFEYIFEANNVKQSDFQITISQNPNADLGISNVAGAAIAVAGQPTTIRWSAANGGTGTTGDGSPQSIVAGWTDRIVFSRDLNFGGSDDTLVADAPHSGELAANGSYAGEWTGTLPPGLSGDYCIFVTLDYSHRVYECPDNLGNRSVSTSITKVATGVFADLTVDDDLTVPASASVGEQITVQWTVRNTPDAWAATPVSRWYDKLVLSRNDVFGDADDIPLKEVQHSGALAKGESYTQQTSLTIPAEVDGDYRLLVKTDSRNEVYEFIYEDNNARGRPMHLSSPNLTVTELSAPASAVAGGQITVSWRVKNAGSAPASRAWSDRLYLSADDRAGAGDTLLATVDSSDVIPLPADGDYQRTATVQVPGNIGPAGTYHLIVVADADGQLNEIKESDNEKPRAITVDGPDLSITVAAPGPMVLTPGQTLAVTGTAYNTGTRDSGPFAVRAVLTLDQLAGNSDDIALQPDYDVPTGLPLAYSPYTATATFTVPSNARDGQYRLGAIIDARNQVTELREDNNTWVSQSAVVIIDTVSPDTRMVAGPPDGGMACSLPVTFSWAGTDDATPVPELQYSWHLDAATWSDWSSATTQAFAILAEGAHEFEVKARDLAGHEDLTPARRRFVVDTEAPAISNVAASPAAGQCTVTWTTGETSTSQVDYGPDQGYGSSTSLNSQLVTSHGVTVSGLTPATLYHFRVKSRDACSHESASEDGTFQTLPDVSAPDTQITSGPGENATACSLPVTFGFSGTDDATPASKLVYSYRMDAQGWSEYDGKSSVAFPDLPGGLHTFEVKAKDLSGNEDATPAVRHFRMDAAPPAISGITASPAAGRCVVAWTTDEPATAQVHYGLTDAYGFSTPVDGRLMTGHSMTITGLSPGTEYHCRVKSRDGCGHEAVSGDLSFSTLPDSTPPGTQIASGVPEGGTACGLPITFGWTGTDDVTPVVQLQFSWRIDDAVWCDWAAATSHAIAALADGLHTLQVKARDTSGNEDESPAERHFTLDTAPPVITDVLATPAAGQCVVTWTTNEPATSTVEYGLTDGYGTRTPPGSQLVTAHRVTVAGLMPGTEYHFRMMSTDACGHEAVSDGSAFTTPADTSAPDTQIISGPAESATVCSPSVAFTWAGTDDVTPVASLVYSYRFDEQAWTEFAQGASATLDAVSHGQHLFEVKARDDAGNEDQTPVARHFSVDTVAPVISGNAGTPSAVGCVLVWTTDKPATSQVEYGVTETYGSFTAEDPRLTISHSVTITGLAPATEYHWRAKSKDACGNERASDHGTFVTLPDTTAPETQIASGPAENTTACSLPVSFSWAGTDDATPIPSLAYAYQVDDLGWTAFGSLTSIALGDLSAGQHTLSVKARDQAGNEDQTPAVRHFRVDIDPPSVSGITAYAAAGQCAISWI
ncbi:MAG TPA: CARDB domain-containing protein, partial [Phycisphaerae bacterium]|nr:CARDB domain-containing protein [Phycisphaerae bacterium]